MQRWIVGKLSNTSEVLENRTDVESITEYRDPSSGTIIYFTKSQNLALMELYLDIVKHVSVE